VHHERILVVVRGSVLAEPSRQGQPLWFLWKGIEGKEKDSLFQVPDKDNHFGGAGRVDIYHMRGKEVRPAKADSRFGLELRD